MKISHKEFLLTGITLAAVGLAAAMIGWAYVEITGATRVRGEAAELLRDVNENRMASFEYRSNRSARVLGQWRSVSARIDRRIAAMEISLPEQMTILEELRHSKAAAQRLFAGLVTQDAAPADAASALAQQRFESQLFSQLIIRQQECFASGYLLLDIASERIKTAGRRALMSILASLALIALLTSGASWIVHRDVLVPIVRLQRATQSVAAGDLEVRLGMARTDEIGEMASNFDAMTQSLQKAFARAERSNREHAAAEERFRTMFESAPSAMVMVDQAGTIVQMNAQTETLFGYSRDELVGQTVDTLVPQRSRGAHAAHREGFAAGAQARRMGADRELYARRKDGREIPVEIGLNPISTAEGRFVLSAIFDLTERKQALQEINQLNVSLVLQAGQLEAANQELESFSYSVSHDLRAPLRAMDGFSLVLLEDYGDKLDAEGKDALERIRAASQRMGGLIDDLLRLANVTRAALDATPVDLSALARECADALQRERPARQVRWQIEPGLRLEADAPLIRIAMQNLIENAWKFSAKTERATIRVGAVEREGDRAFFVADNGAGFDPAHAGRMFDAFQRLHHASEFKGTGIGLAIVKRIVQRHGGRIWAESKPGAGATFYFTVADKGSDSREQRHSSG